MHRSRKEVDEIAHKMLARHKAGKERDMKCLTIARLYININENAKAIEYLNTYLNVNEDYTTHNLIATCYKKLTTPDYKKALQHYQRSIQMYQKQPDIIKDGIQMLLDHIEIYTSERAAYWLGLAESCQDLRGNRIVVDLKVRLLEDSQDKEEDDSPELVIQKQLLINPDDVLLRVSLLQKYLEKKRFDEAFNYAYKTELELPAQCQLKDWYEMVSTVLIKIENKKSKDWPYWQLLLITLDRLVQLNLQSSSPNSLAESTAILFKFDQYLFKFSHLANELSDNGGSELHQCCLNHYVGQLLLHAAALIFKRELAANKNKWPTAVRAALPLLLLGYQQNPFKEMNLQWQGQSSVNQQKLLQLWRYQTAFRCAQLGRTLNGCIQKPSDDVSRDNWEESQLVTMWSNSDDILLAIRQRCADVKWRSHLYQLIYTHHDQKLKENTVQFVSDQRLQQPLYEWPYLTDIEDYEQEALLLAPPLLEYHVYLALCADNLADAPRVRFYEKMRRDSPQKLMYTNPESLCQLDVDIFLYAVVIQAQRILQVERENFKSSFNVGNRNSLARPYMLPFANVNSTEIVTLSQIRWWDIVQNLTKQKGHVSMSIEHREILQRGLEVIRGIKEPGADILIILKLGQLLASREDSGKLEARIEMLYKMGISMIRLHQQHKLETFFRHFKYADPYASSPWAQAQQLAEEALSFLSNSSIKQNKQEEFLKEIRGIQLPMAVYLQAESFGKLAGGTSTSRGARKSFLERRLEYLRQVKNMLLDKLDHPLNVIVQSELKALQADESSNDVHNNSSTYEDAQDDFYSAVVNAMNNSHNRSRRQVETQQPEEVSSELEKIVKQMCKQMCVLKEGFDSSMDSMRQDIKNFTEKLNSIEDMVKKFKISSENIVASPTRDLDTDAVLDEYLVMEDAQQNNYLSNVPPNAQDRFFPHAAYGNPMFNQSQMYNFYASQAQYLRTQPAAGNMPQNLYGPRAPVNYGMPPNMYPKHPAGGLMEGLNYGMAPPPSLVMPQTSQTNLMPGVPAAGYFSNPALGQSPSQPPQQLPSQTQLPQVPIQVPQQLPQATPFGSSTVPIQVPQQMPQATPFGSSAVPIQVPQQLPQATPFGSSAVPIQVPQQMPQTTPFGSSAVPTQGPQQLPQATPFGSSAVPIQVPQQMPQATPFGSSVAQPSVPQQLPQQVSQQPSVSAPSTFSMAASTSVSVNVTSSAPVTTPASAAIVAATVIPPATVFNRALNNQPVEKEPPANVVITSSDPLPKPVVASTQPTLSVTIPPQHIKSSVVQAPEPPSSALTDFKFNMGNKSNIFGGGGASTTFSFKTQVAQAAAEKQKELADEATKNESSIIEANQSQNQNLSAADTSAELDYDPRPDFQGIIPLPDEVEVRTGEEDEQIKFSFRAKLYRYFEKEWKERGTGVIKLLKNEALGTTRVLMRRDQTHKICANHKITAGMTLTTPAQDLECKTFIWAANDFADEKLQLEKLLVRFKLPATASEFKQAFEQAVNEATNAVNPPPAFAVPKNSGVNKFVTSTPAANVLPKKAEQIKPGGVDTKAESAMPKSLFGNLTSQSSTLSNNGASNSPFANFSFGAITNGTPSSLSFGVSASPDTSSANANNSNNAYTTAVNFAGNSFAKADDTLQSQQLAINKTNTSDGDTEDEYVPSAQFAPVIPLPELVEVVTGEENELVLFEHRAKLLRFDKETSEWKERGLGNMKIMQSKSDPTLVRLLMRREQVHKLCCNQRLLPDTKFTFQTTSQNALSWPCQDYSEEELTSELLCVRFKSPDVCKKFHETLMKAQAVIGKKPTTETSKQNTKDEKKDAKPAAQGFGDAFKPKLGSWTCQGCYTSNDAAKLYCLACEAPKDATVPSKPPTVQDSGGLNLSSAASKFSFGFSSFTSTPSLSFGIKPAADKTTPSVDQVAPEVSITLNDTLQQAQKSINETSKKNTADDNKNAKPVTQGFGDAFKPKLDSWSCQGCYTSNDAAKLYCLACEAPKDATVPSKPPTVQDSGALNLSNSANKFSFGISSTASTTPIFNVGTKTASDKSTTPAPKIGFGDQLTNKPTASTTTTAAGGFGDAFKPKAGSWNCKDCYTSNDASHLYCLACQAPKDDSVPKKDNTLDTSGGIKLPATSKFSFGFAQPTVPSITAPEVPKETEVKPADQNNKNESNIFGAGPFNFKPSTVDSANSLGSSTFNFSMSKGGQPKSLGTNIGAGDGNNEDDSHLEEESTAYFAPVIPLPDMIDVKTGEEDEDLLYVHRAKLYRLSEEGEWKERGLGNVKILRQKETKKLRVVMRREQVLKICLNHCLNASVVYKAKDEKTWLFAVHNFSDGESVLERLALRFKNGEIALAFHNAVKSALNGTAQPITDQQQSTGTIPNTTANEADASNEIKVLAEKLMLNPEFLTAVSNCSGCRGCDPDSFNYGIYIPKVENERPPLPLTQPAFKLPSSWQREELPLISDPQTQQGTSTPIFKSKEQSQLNSKSDEKHESQQKKTTTPTHPLLKASTLETSIPTSGLTVGSFSGPSVAGVVSPFSKPSESTPTAPTAPTGPTAPGFLFGNAEQPVFGQSTFGGTGDTSSQKSIFGGKSSIFGTVPQSAIEQKEQPNSIFSSFSNSSSKDPSSITRFTFGVTEKGSAIFGGLANSNSVSFADKSKETVKDSELKEGSKDNKENVAILSGKMDSGKTETTEKKPLAIGDNIFEEIAAMGEDFASLAAKNSGNPIGFQKSESGGFFGLTHQDDFKNFRSPPVSGTTAGNDGGESEDVYDPHYEPIIALPNEIVVSTGEEDEIKLFGERVTLFRHDRESKEWKERGVGEIKVLKHKTKNTYRMVMRREQIHKLVLNMNICSAIAMNYMNEQKKSLCWAGRNFAEGTDGSQESLACRFKKQELAEEFYKTINKCLGEAKATDSETGLTN